MHGGLPTWNSALLGAGSCGGRSGGSRASFAPPEASDARRAFSFVPGQLQWFRANRLDSEETGLQTIAQVSFGWGWGGVGDHQGWRGRNRNSWSSLDIEGELLSP